MSCKKHVPWKPTFHVTIDELMIMKKEPQCSICLDLSDKEKDFTILTCGHVLHFGCITQWFLREDTCPLCRKITTYSQLDYSKVYQNYKSNPEQKETCVICGTKDNRDYIILACNHQYHYSCFTEWISIRKVCPLDNREPKFKDLPA